VKDKQLADDVFQDTFVKVIQTVKSKAYKDDGRFVQFAMRIAHNLVIDHFRKENRIPTVESSSEDYNYIDNVPITDASVEQGMIVDQVHSDLHRMIAFLPDEQREVLRMRIFDDMSFKDIADITNVSINTALGRMRYALINLRKMMVANNMTLTY
jgi:RNA polymerase sigma-70 factor (ECF subfamily)